MAQKAFVLERVPWLSRGSSIGGGIGVGPQMIIMAETKEEALEILKTQPKIQVYKTREVTKGDYGLPKHDPSDLASKEKKEALAFTLHRYNQSAECVLVETPIVVAVPLSVS